MSDFRVNFPPRPLARSIGTQSLPIMAKPSSLSQASTTKVLAAPADLLKAYANVRFAASNAVDQTASISNKEKPSAYQLYKEMEVEDVHADETQPVPDTMSFWQYVRQLEKDPAQYLRSSSKYTVDAMEHYGTNKGKIMGQDVTLFNFVKRPWRSSLLRDQTNLGGQELALDQLYNILKLYSVQKTADRMIVLHGPNGSGKNETMNTLFEMLEDYSKQDNGARYTFSWVFRNSDEFKKIMMPVPGDKTITNVSDKQLRDPGIIPQEKIGLKIPASLNTNPVFLLSSEDREALLNKLLQQGKINHNFNADFVLEGGRLDSNSKTIFEALMERYKGDLVKVLSHVQVERWTLSKQQGKGLTTIPSGPVFNAGLQPLTGTLNMELLPSSLQTKGIHLVKGSIPDASGGHIQLTDMLKKHPDEFKFLLETAQTGMISIKDPRSPATNIEEQLDAVFWSDVNDKDIIDHMMRDQQFESLQKRFRHVQIPYIRMYRSEAEVYRFKLKQIIPPDRHVSPHALEAFSLWTTMTRLFPPNPNWPEYQKIPGLSQAISGSSDKEKMTILEKALLYQGEDPNSFELDPDKKKYKTERLESLQRNLGKLSKEYHYGVGKTRFLFYEGGTGISAREAKEILEESTLVNPEQCFSVVEVFKSLDELIKHGLPYMGELNRYFKEANDQKIPGTPPGGKPPDAADLLNQAKGHMQRQIQSEIKSALGIYDVPEEHIRKLQRYVEHVKALVLGQPVATGFRSPTSLDEQPDMEFIREMEKTVLPKGMAADKFRREKILSRTAAWEHQKPADENIRKLYSDELNLMRSEDEKHNLNFLQEFREDVNHYWRHPEDFNVNMLQGTARKRAERLHDALSKLAPENPEDAEKCYCIKCLPKIIDWAFGGQLPASKS